jgi:HK97 family phage portal protein
MGAITKMFNKVKFINDTGAYEGVIARFVSMYGSDAGIMMDANTALSVPAIFNCIRIIAEDCAKLPLHLYRRTGENCEKMMADPLYMALHDTPNPLMTAQEFRECATGHVLLRGNSYSQIIKSGSSVELWPLNPDRMQVKLADDDGAPRIVYEYTPRSGLSPRSFPESEILHIRGWSPDGIIGYSPISVFADAMGLAKAQSKFAGRFFRNNATPHMAIKHPNKLSPAAYQNLKDSWKNEHGGLDNAGGFGILEEGMSIEKLGFSNEDSQFLESREFSVIEICQMFRMPPHKTASMKNATFSNIEHQAIEYVVDTLQPWLERWEQRLNIQLLGAKRIKDGWYFEHDVNGLLRGDIKARFDAYNVGRNGGWMSRNDVRRMENMNPIAGGDDYLTPANMMTLGEKPPETNGGGPKI